MTDAVPDTWPPSDVGPPTTDMALQLLGRHHGNGIEGFRPGPRRSIRLDRICGNDDLCLHAMGPQSSDQLMRAHPRGGYRCPLLGNQVVGDDDDPHVAIDEMTQGWSPIGKIFFRSLRSTLVFLS